MKTEKTQIHFFKNRSLCRRVVESSSPWLFSLSLVTSSEVAKLNSGHFPSRF